MARKTKKRDRLDELQDMLKDTRRLSPVEYLDLLYEVQAVSLVKLNIAVRVDADKLMGQLSGVLEKTHYLIDSAETRAQRLGQGVHRTLGWSLETGGPETTIDA